MFINKTTINMTDISSIGGQKLPSILKDPFSKVCVKRISVSVYLNGNNWMAHGNVDFVNGQTEGSQKFAGTEFDEVVLKIREFIKELENKNQ